MKATLVLFAFITALIENDLKKAFSFTSKTWADKNSSDNLKKLLPQSPKSFEIGMIKKASPTRMVIGVDFTESKSMTFDLVCESWPGKYDPYGDWGVVPDSIKEIEYASIAGDENPDSPDTSAKLTVKLHPAKLKKLKGLTAKAEDLGIEIPEGATIEILEKLISEVQNTGGQ